MQKIFLFIVALVFSLGTCSQFGGRRTQTPAPATGTRQAFMTWQSVFFEDGSLDEFTTYQWDAGFNHIDTEIRHSASGAMLEQIEFSYHEERGFLQTRITRDVEHRLRNRVVYQYTPEGQLWRESLVDNKGRVVSSFEFTYDDRGNRVSRVMRNRAGDRLAETLFTYDAQGRLLVSETRDGGGNTISSTRFSYDAQGNLVAQQTFNNVGTPTTSVRATWQDGLEVRNEMISAEGRLLMRITNEFGQERELVERIMDNIQGESLQIMRFDYVFRPRR